MSINESQKAWRREPTEEEWHRIFHGLEKDERCSICKHEVWYRAQTRAVLPSDMRDKFQAVPAHNDGAIICVRCGQVLSSNYDADRGKSESPLYAHSCPHSS